MIGRGRWGRTGAGGTANAAAVLMAGRTIGFAVTFAIPLVLARVLDQQAFGTYKYLFMLASTLAVLQVGMAESLYYFVPRRGPDAGSAIANAIVTLGVMGLVLVGGVFVARGPVARLLGQGAVAPYLPILAAFVGFTLVAMPLEIVMVSRRAYTWAAGVYAASDGLRALLLIVPGILFRSLPAVLWGAVAFAAVRTAAMAGYLLRTTGGRLVLDRREWRAQIAYAGPFAVAVVIETLQMNFHQYVVWARSDPATFAIYAAGCLQVPLVDVLTTSVGNVMMVRMADEVARPAAGLALWHQAVERLAFWLWPLTAALALTAHDLIVLLFTARYAASVPVFVVSTGAIALAVFQVDSVLRVHARTTFLIVMNLIRLAVVVGGIWWAMASFHLLGAIGITIVAMGVAKAAALWRISRLFNVSILRVVPWKALIRIGAITAATTVIVLGVRPVLPALPPLAHGAMVACIFGVIYLGAEAARRGSEWLDAMAARPASRLDRP